MPKERRYRSRNPLFFCFWLIHIALLIQKISAKVRICSKLTALKINKHRKQTDRDRYITPKRIPFQPSVLTNSFHNSLNTNDGWPLKTTKLHHFLILLRFRKNRQLFRSINCNSCKKMAQNTDQQFEHVIKVCREVFEKKMTDYGTAWRILRPESVTDQIFIKAQRIRSLQIKGISKVDEGIRPEFIGIINYAAMAIIQLELGVSDNPVMPHDEALERYLKAIDEAKSLMENKNHDYDEAWRNMRISSLSDLILMKLFRIKEIEDHKGKTIVSEGVEANYMDIINYAAFALIKIDFAE